MRRGITQLLFLFTLLLSGGQAFAHEFYISLCNIDYNPETSALEITFKIFTDDLEAVTIGSEHPFVLGTEREPLGADSMIFSYISENFQLSANDRSLTPLYVGKEVEEDVCWIYIEITGVESFSKLEVSNSMLIEKFPGQVNVVNITYQGKTRGLLMKRDDTEGMINFDQ